MVGVIILNPYLFTEEDPMETEETDPDVRFRPLTTVLVCKVTLSFITCYSLLILFYNRLFLLKVPLKLK